MEVRLVVGVVNHGLVDTIKTYPNHYMVSDWLYRRSMQVPVCVFEYELNVLK